MGTMQYSLTCCIVKYFNKVNIFLKKHNSIFNVNPLLFRLKHPAVSKKNGGIHIKNSNIC